MFTSRTSQVDYCTRVTVSGDSTAMVGLQNSGYAAATLGAVGKDDTKKAATLKAATKELERSFNKADFKRMKVLKSFQSTSHYLFSKKHF